MDDRYIRAARICGGDYPNLVSDSEKCKPTTTGEKAWDPHLCGTRHVSGYVIQTSDAEIGHVENFIIDDEMWAIRYLIIDTQDWWPGGERSWLP